MYLLHRRRDLYPEPDEFRPERFLGKRMIEMKTILATILSTARLRIENPDAAVRRRGFFLTPEGGPGVALSAPG